MENLSRGCGLTLDDVGHLLRPPGCVFDGRWLKDIASPGLLIAIDARHMWLIYQVIYHFWTVGGVTLSSFVIYLLSGFTDSYLLWTLRSLGRLLVPYIQCFVYI